MPNPVLSQKRWDESRESGPDGWASPTGAAGATATGTTVYPPGAAPTPAPGTLEPGKDQHGGRSGDYAFGTQRAPHVPSGRTMTIGGTLTATGVLLVLLLATGVIGWMQVTQTSFTPQPTATDPNPAVQITTHSPGWVFLPVIAALIAGLVLAFKPRLAVVLAPVYVLCFGFTLGAISHMYDLQYDGIVIQAIGATLGVFVMMFFLYATRIVKVTPKLALGIIAATGGIFLLYMVTFILSIFGVDMTFWNEPSPLGIGISVVIVCVAAFNLMLDFNFIEKASAAGEPKYMEWYGAFGLTVTLIWLYLELLRLLSLLKQ
jgi:uncharacterized YccA/Bax inhibitor family protein